MTSFGSGAFHDFVILKLAVVSAKTEVEEKQPHLNNDQQTQQPSGKKKLLAFEASSFLMLD